MWPQNSAAEEKRVKGAIDGIGKKKKAFIYADCNVWTSSIPFQTLFTLQKSHNIISIPQ